MESRVFQRDVSRFILYPLVTPTPSLLPSACFLSEMRLWPSSYQTFNGVFASLALTLGVKHKCALFMLLIFLEWLVFSGESLNIHVRGALVMKHCGFQSVKWTGGKNKAQNTFQLNLFCPVNNYYTWAHFQWKHLSVVWSCAKFYSKLKRAFFPFIGLEKDLRVPREPLFFVISFSFFFFFLSTGQKLHQFFAPHAKEELRRCIYWCQPIR